jgi:predicted Zn-dependent protease
MIEARILLLSALALPLMGCAAPKTALKKQEAQAQWSQVKGRIKLQLARRSLDQGLVDEAIRQCGEALGQDPSSIDAHILMAQACLEKGDDAQAEAALRHAALLNSAHPDLYYFSGVLAERRNQLPQALEMYQKAYDARRGDVDYLVSCATVLLRSDRPERAWQLLKSRQADFPEEASVRFLLGQALSLMDRKAEAAEALSAAVRLAPEDSLLRREAGLALLSIGELDEAVQVLKPLLIASTDKCSASLIRCVAAAMLARNQAAQAIKILDPATAAHPDDASLWLLLAQAHATSGSLQEGARAAARAAQIDGNSSEGPLLLAYISMVSGQKEQAIRTAKQILQKHPSDHEAAAILARAQQR